VGIEAGRASHDLEIAVAATTFKASVDVAAALAPGAPDRAALGDHIGPQVELVAVAGTGEGLIEAAATFANRIRGSAANAFSRTVVEGDAAAAGPEAGHAGEGALLGVAYCTGERSHQ